jgi:hypothetical protein
MRSRSGIVLLFVIGLIMIMASLTTAIMVRVYNSIKTSGGISQSAQSWIMLRSASLILGTQAADGGLPWSKYPSGITIGNLKEGDIPEKSMDDRLGWARISQIAIAGETYFYVTANGGSSAGTIGNVLLKEESVLDGIPIRNALDVRFCYLFKLIPADAMNNRFAISALSVASESYISDYYW